MISARRYELPLATTVLAQAALQLAEYRITIFPTAVVPDMMSLDARVTASASHPVAPGSCPVHDAP
ncbi:hypothetical protein WME97_00665 [Sorangium sp. So ce367]